MYPRQEADPEHGAERRGLRQDGRNIVTEWLRHKRDQGHAARYAWNSDQFHQADPAHTDALIGAWQSQQH